MIQRRKIGRIPLVSGKLILADLDYVDGWWEESGAEAEALDDFKIASALLDEIGLGPVIPCESTIYGAGVGYGIHLAQKFVYDLYIDIGADGTVLGLYFDIEHGEADKLIPEGRDDDPIPEEKVDTPRAFLKRLGWLPAIDLER